MMSETPLSEPPTTNLESPNLINWEDEPYGFSVEPSGVDFEQNYIYKQVSSKT